MQGSLTTMVCEICGAEVVRARRDQTTCGSKECRSAYVKAAKDRDRIENLVALDIRAINALRESHGLINLKPGKTTCLRCDKEFESWSKAHNRICPACKRQDLECEDEREDLC